MSKLTQQQRNDALAFWAFGWKRHKNWYYDRDGNQVRRALSGTNIWRPFISRDDAFMLLEKCEQEGLEQKYLDALISRIVAGCLSQPASMKSFGWLLEMATAKQKTEAVLAVAGLEEKLGEDDAFVAAARFQARHKKKVREAAKAAERKEP